ncbi:putative AP-4 complex subunit mu-1 [Hibiscus syriacus]|uniref:AP-4 complex subunit mu-1 n=1 Tax=Hibiscus syriacus TaxID=106335 RepID=A0A6A2XWT1_HIBSY|nr:putative AP-4 complex subunit mu-1 [Hibiscus syriacus]
MDITCHEFHQLSGKPNRSGRKLLYRVEAHSFLEIPPLVVQVTNLHCGGMILCTTINHCICDGLGTSQFLHTWSHVITKAKLDFTLFHSRHVLKPRDPPQITHTHLDYTKTTLEDNPTHVDVNQYLQSQPLVPTSFTFTSAHVLRLKRQCSPSLKCTTFEALASHTWRSWVRSLDLSPPSLKVKLLFSVNFRKKLIPALPQGYYGNGFVLACTETAVKDLVTGNLHHGIKLIQEAKSSLIDGNVRSMIDLLEDKNVKTDTCSSLVISQWAKLGLEDLDFGEGKALHMGPLTSDIYCLFLPVVGNFDAIQKFENGI